MPWPTILPFPNPIPVHNTISKCKIIAAQPRVDFNVVLDFTLSQRGERADRVQLVPFLYCNITTMLISSSIIHILYSERRRHSRKKDMDLRSPEIEPSLSGILLKATVAILVKMARRPC